jgi:CRISPR-associated protein Cas1
MLSSTRLGVVAKMDLVEVQVKRRVDGAMADLFAPRHLDVQSVTPVDYKAGAPKIGAEQNELWDADKMQLGLQILILREMATPAMKGSFTTAPQSSACPCA